MKLEKDYNINELIPKLIQKSKSLSKEMKNRIKLNHIFSEFEAKASNQFNFFIKESEKRYLCSKYGSKMEYLLKSSEKRGKKEANKILSDNFYINSDIFRERKKMLKRSTNEIYQSTNEIIKKIKGIKTEGTNKNKLNLINIHLNQDKEKMERNKLEIKSLLTKEENSISKSFHNYKNILSQIKPFQKKININEESEEENENIKIKRNMDFNIPRMNLLYYTKPYIHVKTNKEEDEENRINIKKLLPYTLSGKNLLSKEKKVCAMNPLLIKKNKDPFYMNSTNTIVLKKALNEFNTLKRYKNKKNEIYKRLEGEKIPSLKIYENMIKKGFNKTKLERKNINDFNFNNQKYLGINSKEQLNCKIQDNLNYLTNFEKNNIKYNTISV